MTKQEINKRKNGQRSVRAEIKIYDYSRSPLGEPSKSKLESLKFDKVTIRTYRRDYRKFSFVRCQLNGQLKTLVIRFDTNQIERLSCQLLEKWDPRVTII